MIVSFYDKNFKGLQNNASLAVDRDSYSLIKRPVETNSLSCRCEAFTEDIQPTFLIIKDDVGRYVYGSLAGIPILNEDNITEITGTDLKSMLSSDVILDISNGVYSTVNSYLAYVFNQWKSQCNQGTIECELQFKSYITDIPITDYAPVTGKAVYNALEEIQGYLRYYNLYLDTSIDLIGKKVIFTIGRTMYRLMNIKLWEIGIRDYGKWVASVNETQGYYIDKDTGDWTAGSRWILTSNNQITTNEGLRDIYPIKRKVYTSQEDLKDADTQALTELLNCLFNENINLDVSGNPPDFETKFAIYLKRGGAKYKDLPCGELQYDASGLKKYQIGYRYTGAEFI